MNKSNNYYLKKFAEAVSKQEVYHPSNYKGDKDTKLISIRDGRYRYPEKQLTQNQIDEQKALDKSRSVETMKRLAKNYKNMTPIDFARRSVAGKRNNNYAFKSDDDIIQALGLTSDQLDALDKYYRKGMIGDFEYGFNKDLQK